MLTGALRIGNGDGGGADLSDKDLARKRERWQIQMKFQQGKTMWRRGFVIAAVGGALCCGAQSVVAQAPVGTIGGGVPAVAVAMAPRLNFTLDEMALAQAAAADPDLAAYYGANGLKPLFQGAHGQQLAAALSVVVAEAPRHGIPRGRYDSDALTVHAQTAADEVRQGRVLVRYLRDMTGGVVRPSTADNQIYRQVHRPSIPGLMARLAASDDPEGILRGIQPRHPAYLALQQALTGPVDLRAPADLPLVPEALWRPGMDGVGVLPLRDRLASIGFVAPTENPIVYDARLAEAVAGYQQAVGLPADGVAGPMTIRALNGDGQAEGGRGRAIAVALERLRWMGGEDLQARHVWVNIPEFTARIMDGGQEVFRTRTVVGKTDHDQRTPEFSDQMEHVVVNPRWNVPRSITVKEYLPRLKANRNAVAHLDVVDSKGNIIPRDRIDFGRYTAANFPYRMRQKPSDDNALGLVKFIFPNPWNIYLHDTPTKHLFGNSVRAYSHGCIRIGDPFDLAYQLLSQQTDDPQRMFRRALDSGRETYLALKPNVPVHLVYFTAWPEPSGGVRLFPDLYGRDAAIWEALQRAGGDPGLDSSGRNG